MGTTGNYGFHYPESTDAPDGAGQMQTLAEDVDTSLKTVDNKASAVPKILAGQVTVNPNASRQWLSTTDNGDTYYLGSTAVTFSSAFNSNPIVVCSANASVPGVIVEVSAASVTTTGFIAYASRAQQTAVTVNWVAIGS